MGGLHTKKKKKMYNIKRDRLRVYINHSFQEMFYEKSKSQKSLTALSIFYKIFPKIGLLYRFINYALRAHVSKTHIKIC